MPAHVPARIPRGYRPGRSGKQAPVARRLPGVEVVPLDDLLGRTLAGPGQAGCRWPGEWLSSAVSVLSARRYRMTRPSRSAATVPLARR